MCAKRGLRQRCKSRLRRLLTRLPEGSFLLPPIWRAVNEEFPSAWAAAGQSTRVAERTSAGCRAADGRPRSPSQSAKRPRPPPAGLHANVKPHCRVPVGQVGSSDRVVTSGRGDLSVRALLPPSSGGGASHTRGSDAVDAADDVGEGGGVVGGAKRFRGIGGGCIKSAAALKSTVKAAATRHVSTSSHPLFLLTCAAETLQDAKGGAPLPSPHALT